MQALKPPDWHIWNSPGFRRQRDEEGWLEAQLAKAKRLYWQPIDAEFSKDDCNHNSQELHTMALKWVHEEDINQTNKLNSFLNLAGRLCEEAGLNESTLLRHFPSYGAQDNNNHLADADPFNLYLFVCTQIAWKAVTEGWAVCIAVDYADLSWPLTDPTYACIDARDFPILGERHGLASPRQLGVHEWIGLQNRAESKFGAYSLRFVLTRDLLKSHKDVLSRSGPLSGNHRRNERIAEEFVRELCAKRPSARIKREEFCDALTDAGFSKKAAGRIWTESAPGLWKKPGPIPKSTELIELDELIRLLEDLTIKPPRKN